MRNARRARRKGSVKKLLQKHTSAARHFFSENRRARSMADTFRGAQHDAAVTAAGFARHQPARGWEAEAGEGETLSTIIAFDRQLRQLCTLHHDTCAAETRCQLLAAAQDDAARLPRALTDVRKAWHVWRKWCVEKLLQKHTSTAQHFFQKIGASGPWQIHSGALSTMPLL